MTTRKIQTTLAAFCAVLLIVANSSGQDPSERLATILKNDRIVAELSRRGLRSIHDVALNKTVQFGYENCFISVDDARIDTGGERPKDVVKGEHSLAFVYDVDDLEMRVVYELKPGWRFLSKQVFITRPGRKEYLVKKIELFRAKALTPVAYHHIIDREWKGVWAGMLRFVGNDDKDPGYGMFFTIQNPMMKWTCYYNADLSLSYEPEMAWRSEYGEFASDRACIGIYPLSGTEFPAKPISENVYLRNPDQAIAWAQKVDIAEILALQDCVRQFLMVKRDKSLRIDVGWCMNDYQIDLGTPEGRTEYKRIIDRSAAMGVSNIILSAANYEIATLKENRDCWGWENVLWLGLGQKIRKDEWDPNKDPIPDSLQEMLDYAKAKEVGCVAYVYPTVPFMQDPAWTAWTPHVGGYAGPDNGLRGFQDWLIAKLVDFQKSTGASGYSFDLWYLNGGTSEYAQWYGMRRVLEELRERIPDVVLDGRQTHHAYGPWTCLSGIYPHPFGYDEQPGSFGATADLHTDRLSANHTRAMNWMFSMQAFCPIEVVPGFITHQTQRGDAEGKLRRDRFRPRDWDYLGWRYSLLSSIATAPFNHVVNMIPARDEDEFKAFSKKDEAEFRGWLDWTDREMDVLRNVRPIIGPPMIDRVDGTAAFKGAHGYIFLFNPNYQRMNATFRLDQSIGLTEGDRLTITQLYPRKGMNFGKTGAGFWRRGDEVVLPMEGANAVVLEVTPVTRVAGPVLFNAVGAATLRGSSLQLADVTGEVGTESDILAAVPEGREIRSVTINAKPVQYNRKGDVLSMHVRFAGEHFSHCQQVGEYDHNFGADSFTGEFTIPARVFNQLEARKRAWPVPYTEDDLLATWLGPWRLLLFVNIAHAESDMDVSMTIDGKPVEIRKAYNGIYGGDRTFMGFYSDVSSLKPDTKYRVEVRLPHLEAGRFHGLYFENVETEYTQEIVTD